MRRLLAIALCLVAILPACASPTATPGVSPTAPLPSATTAAPTRTATPAPTPSTPPTATPTPAPARPLSLVEQWQFGDEYTEAFWTLDVADLNGDGNVEIVAGSHDHLLYALNADGSMLWKYRTAAAIYSAAIVPSPDGSPPRVLVGDDADQVYLVDAEGHLVWKTRLDGRVTYVAASPTGLFAATWKGYVYGLGSGGRVKWEAPIGGAPTSLEVCSIGGADLLASTDSGLVLGLNSEGTIVWQQVVADVSVVARPSNVAGTSGWIAGDQAGRLSAWDGTKMRWQVETQGGIPAWTEANLPQGPAVIVGAGQPTDAVSALSADGQTLWSAQVPGGVWHLTTADLDGDGVGEILASTEGGSVTVLSADGQIRGMWASPSRVVQAEAMPVGQDGAVQVVLREGRFVHGLAPELDAVSSPPVQPGPPTLATAAGPAPVEGEVLLAAAGDVMMGRTIEEYAGKYGLAFPFAPVSAALQSADLAVANLECAIPAGGEPVAGKTYVFRAHPALASALAQSGLDVVGLANNHALDFGTDGYQETVDAVSSQGIAVVGAGQNREDAQRPVIRDVGGVKIALLAYVAYAPPGFAATDAAPGVNYLDNLDNMAEQVREASELADVVIVIFHSGDEYSVTPNARQRQAAHIAIDAGADLIIGHHPHVLQTVETYKGRLIVYSLGDFLFDIDNYDAARDGAVLWVWLDKAGVARAELWYTRIVNDAQVQFVAGADGQPKRDVLVP